MNTTREFLGTALMTAACGGHFNGVEVKHHVKRSSNNALELRLLIKFDWYTVPMMHPKNLLM